jgi:hypothetical protein
MLTHHLSADREDQSRAELQMAEQTRADFLSALELNPGAPELIAELQELDKIICRCQRRIEFTMPREVPGHPQKGDREQ